MMSCLERLQDRFFYCYGRILRRSKFKLPGRHSTIQIRLREEAVPFHLRLGSTDWLVLEEIYLQGEYAAVSRFIREARTIVDLGANVGFSLRYWQKIFPAARIIAMEPDPGNCRVCHQNIRAAGFENRVTLLQAGVGPRRTRARLTDGNGEWAYRVEETHAGEAGTIEMFSLTEVLHRHAAGQQIDLLKCDIEGGESALFRKCRPWIGRVEAIAIELHPPYTREQLLADLSEASAEFAIVATLRDKTFPLLLLRRKSGRGG